MNYAKHVSSKQTPQSEPIPGSKQIKNSAGGFSWEVDSWTKLDRFLILGTEGGSYYASEKKMTQASAAAVIALIKTDGVKVVSKVVEISDEGRAVKNDPALFVLALAAKLGDLDTRRAAFAALPKVARIGTHLFHWAAMVKDLGGWGRGTTRAISDWYLTKTMDQTAMQFVKYQQRDKWSHKDLLRLAHVKATNAEQHALFRWALGVNFDAREVKRVEGKKEIRVDKYDSVSADSLPDIVQAFERAKAATSATEIVRLIVDHKLPREAVPTQWLKETAVWEALLPHMGITALIRNLGKMTSVGLIAPMSAATKHIEDQLSNVDVLRKGRVHPLSLLVALKTYSQGHGEKGKLTWKTQERIKSALDSAFYLAFKAVEPTNKRTLLALDISGSMDGSDIAGMNIDAREGSAAMALVTANVESQHEFIAFTTNTSQLKISPKHKLEHVCTYLRGLHMGGTDCAEPMMWALRNNVSVDTFCVYTDSETWAGSIHPKQALDKYRQKTGIPAKLVTVGMCSNDFTIADPNDRGMMDVCGFDTSAPSVIANFSRE